MFGKSSRDTPYFFYVICNCILRPVPLPPASTATNILFQPIPAANSPSGIHRSLPGHFSLTREVPGTPVTSTCSKSKSKSICDLFVLRYFSTGACLFSLNERSCDVFFDPKQLSLRVSCFCWCYFAFNHQPQSKTPVLWCFFVVFVVRDRAQDREGNSKKVARYFRHNYSIWRTGCSIWKSGAIWTIHRKYKTFVCSRILSRRTLANHETEAPPIQQDLKVKFFL